VTNSRRDSRICLALAALCTASGVYFATQPSWLCVLGFYGAAFLGWCASRLNADHRRQLSEHEQARRAAIRDGTTLADLPVACCSFWIHSDREVHGPDCTRPASARGNRGVA
jgi:threonine/homoserine/homoserine lactone efflux protein